MLALAKTMPIANAAERLNTQRELPARSCSCNALVRDHFEEVLRRVYPTNGNEDDKAAGEGGSRRSSREQSSPV